MDPGILQLVSLGGAALILGGAYLFALTHLKGGARFTFVEKSKGLLRMLAFALMSGGVFWWSSFIGITRYRIDREFPPPTAIPSVTAVPSPTPGFVIIVPTRTLEPSRTNLAGLTVENYLKALNIRDWETAWSLLFKKSIDSEQGPILVWSGLADQYTYQEWLNLVSGDRNTINNLSISVLDNSQNSITVYLEETVILEGDTKTIETSYCLIFYNGGWLIEDWFYERIPSCLEGGGRG